MRGALLASLRVAPMILAPLHFAATAVIAEEPPVVGIPMADRERCLNAMSAEAFSVDDWAGAASVSHFTATGFGRAIPEGTTVHMMHDGRDLYAAFVCHDATMGGRAHLRPYGEDLTQDEAVQLVLGVEDDTDAKRLEMGGYEGAQGVELPPVAHYYEFTANRAGAIGRQYNETPLPHPRFSARILEAPGQWYALFHVPLSSAGIDAHEGRVVYLNLFRFYRSERYGLHLPGFGGYQPMPFALAELLPTEREAEASTIGPRPPPAREGPEPPSAAEIQIEYFALADKVCAAFPPDAARRRGRLHIRGSHATAVERLSELRPTVVTLPLQDSEVEGELTAVARTEGGEASTEARFVRYTGAVPEWYGTDAGAEYLADRVPRPWTPPVAEGSVVTLAHAKVGFGQAALPESISIQGHPLLAGPVMVDARAGGSALRLAGLAEVRAEATRALAVSKDAEVGLEARTMVDFDGFMVIRLRARGVPASRLERLEVRIPLAEGVARYVNRGSVQDTLAVGTGGYAGNASELWVGNASIGLAFSFDRRCFFGDADGQQLEVITHADGTSELIARLVGGRGQVADDGQVFQFFLQGTPFRSEPVPPQCDVDTLWFEEWSDYQGYPDLAKLPEVRARADQAHADGRRLYLYFSQCLAENSPGFDSFGSEWVAPPDRVWYQRAYEPGKGVPCRVSCFRGAAGDLLLHGFERLAEEGNLDGLYFDGPSHPFSCDSIGHSCSDSLQAAWDDDFRTGRILGQRAFLKRARGIFDARGREAIIWAHTGGGLNLATLSLCDLFYEGEQLARYRPGYMIDPDKFLVGYSGKPFGLRTFLLPVLYFDAAHDAPIAGALGLVHDVETSFGDYRPAAQDRFFSLATQRGGEAVFYGYWQEQPHIRVDGDLLVSYYRAADEAIVAVSNLRYEGAKHATIRLGAMFETDTVDVLAYGERDVLTRGCTSLDAAVEEGGMRLFRVTPSGRAPDPPPEPEPQGVAVTGLGPITAFREEDWQLTGNTQPLPDGLAMDMPYSQSSVLYSDELIAALALDLPRTFTLRARIAFSGVLRLRIDETSITYDGWTPWEVRGFRTLDPVGRCIARPRMTTSVYPPVTPGDAAELAVYCRDDRLTVMLDGRFIVDRMLPEIIYRSHRVDFATWGGHWMGLDVLEIQEGASPPERIQIHPVR